MDIKICFHLNFKLIFKCPLGRFLDCVSHSVLKMLMAYCQISQPVIGHSANHAAVR